MHTAQPADHLPHHALRVTVGRSDPGDGGHVELPSPAGRRPDVPRRQRWWHAADRRAKRTHRSELCSEPGPHPQRLHPSPPAVAGAPMSRRVHTVPNLRGRPTPVAGCRPAPWHRADDEVPRRHALPSAATTTGAEALALLAPGLALLPPLRDPSRALCEQLDSRGRRSLPRTAEDLGERGLAPHGVGVGHRVPQGAAVPDEDRQARRPGESGVD